MRQGCTASIAAHPSFEKVPWALAAAVQSGAGGTYPGTYLAD